MEWVYKEIPTDQINALNNLAINPFLVRLLIRNGIQTPEEASPSIPNC
jgi:hypothetical protein